VAQLQGGHAAAQEIRTGRYRLDLPRSSTTTKPGKKKREKVEQVEGDGKIKGPKGRTGAAIY